MKRAATGRLGRVLVYVEIALGVWILVIGGGLYVDGPSRHDAVTMMVAGLFAATTSWWRARMRR